MIPEADVQRLLLHSDDDGLLFCRRCRHRRRLSARLLLPPLPLFVAAVEDPANANTYFVLAPHPQAG